MIADELHVEDSIPSGVIFILVWAAKMRAYDHPAIAASQVMNSFKRQVEETPDAGVVGDTIIIIAGHINRHVKVTADEDCFPNQIRRTQGIHCRQSNFVVHVFTPRRLNVRTSLQA